MKIMCPLCELFLVALLYLDGVVTYICERCPITNNKLS